MGFAVLKQKQLEETGASMIEYAIILPVFILLLAGLIQYGWILATQMTVKNAVAVAARHATLSIPQPEEEDIKTTFEEALVPLANASNVLSFNYDDNYTSGAITGAKQVQVDYQLALFFSFVVPGSNNGVLTIQEQVIMR